MIHFVAKGFETLAPYVPFFQSLVWPVFIFVVLWVFRRQTMALFDTLRCRIERGSSLKAGPFQLGRELQSLEYVQPSGNGTQNVDETGGNWERDRIAVYRRNHGIFLAYVLVPSKKPEKKYDIFIYLIRHKTTDTSDIDYAEFFFGHMWGNRVFKEFGDKGVIGVSTSAYGPFLCICRVHLKDGTVILLERYIDFEMGTFLYGECN